MYLIEDVVTSGSRLSVKANSRFTRDCLWDDFFVEYSEDIGLDRMEPTVVLAPFVLNVAPLVWFSGATYRIDALDADLAQALEAIRSEMRRLYPQHRWAGRIEPDRLTHNAVELSPEREQTALLFTGGVDSIYTSLIHYPAPQRLITIWGSETRLNDPEKWQRQSGQYARFASDFGHRNLFVKTNAKEMVRRKRIGRSIPVWWAYVQHGMGLPGLSAPALFRWGQPTVLMSSTEWRDGYAGPWGSSPEIDNRVRCAGVQTRHVGFEVTRQQKIDYIVEKVRRERLPTVSVTVCSRPHVRDNSCGACEKCLRTMTGFIVAGSCPATFGFRFSAAAVLEKVRLQFETRRMVMDPQLAQSWAVLQASIRVALKTDRYATLPDTQRDILRWLSQFDMDAYCADYLRRRRWSDVAKELLSKRPFLFELARRWIESRGWFGY